jgi:alkaline phosphatase
MKMSSLRKYAALLLVLIVPTLIWAEGAREPAAEIQSPQARYVFLFIGDGMSMTQINAAEAYLKSQRETDIGVEKLAFSQFPNQGLTTTYDAGSFITDSASAGTAIATGHKTLSGVINMDTSKSIKYTTIAEMAKAAGMKVGVISSVNLDHATPACFYAKEASRNNYYNIGVQLANSSFDYFAGGMLRLDKTPQGQKNVHEIMAGKGWVIADNREKLQSLRPGNRQVYAYARGFAGNALDYSMDMKADNVTLAEFTAKGIELLDNKKGFFMMVEGGKIDWACHANDAAASIHNTVAFDNAVKEAIEFYRRHPEETLIIVTGDHETGGLSLGFAGTKYDSAFSEISRQKMSFESFDHYVLKPFKQENPNGSLVQLMPEIRKNFGIESLSAYERELLEKSFTASMKGVSENEESYLLYGGYEPVSVTLTHILNNRAGLAWASYSHTGVPVPTFALGVGGELFNGYYDNTEIFQKAAAVLGLGSPALASR